MLDALIARLKALPENDQARVAIEIEAALDAHAQPQSVLTPEQWTEVEAALREPDGELIPHGEVFAALLAPNDP